MNKFTEYDYSRIRALYAGTTPNNWVVCTRDNGDKITVEAELVDTEPVAVFPRSEYAVGNAAFVALAHLVIPKLLAALRNEETENVMLKELAQSEISYWEEKYDEFANAVSDAIDSVHKREYEMMLAQGESPREKDYSEGHYTGFRKGLREAVSVIERAIEDLYKETP